MLALEFCNRSMEIGVIHLGLTQLELNRPYSGGIWERQDDQEKTKTAQTIKL